MKWKFWPVVEYSPNHLKVKGSSPATTAGTGRVKLAKKREANVWDQPVVRDRCLPRRTLVQIRWRQDNGVHRQRREWSSCREDIQRPSVFERVFERARENWNDVMSSFRPLSFVILLMCLDSNPQTWDMEHLPFKVNWLLLDSLLVSFCYLR